MTDYNQLCEELKSLSEGVKWDITVLANASALIWTSMENLNWAGFYIMKEGRLVLGPFQGKVACTQIEVGRGVCGTAVKEDRSLVVPDVHKFPTHIACDSASNSEIVIPIHKDGEVYGVLDIDSPLFSRFDSSDRQGLEAFVNILEERI
ncbi:MAG: GAF domain-containing protein [Sphaerochaetaceae bacterium]|nr:GAF domain-containing protein [Sphaerochaetaceae bacterium]